MLQLLAWGTDVARLCGGAATYRGLSVFVALWSAVRERCGDLASVAYAGRTCRRHCGALAHRSALAGAVGRGTGPALGQVLPLALAHFCSSTIICAWLRWPGLTTLAWVPVLALGEVSLGAALLPALGVYRLQVPLLQERQARTIWRRTMGKLAKIAATVVVGS